MATPYFLTHLGSQESKERGGPGPERRPRTPKFCTLGDRLIEDLYAYLGLVVVDYYTTVKNLGI